jgi:Concanavalin A-like lectin/glucanases superfamily
LKKLKLKKSLTILLLLFAFISNAQSVSISSSASGSICAGTSMTFTATTSGISSPTYQWYKNGTAISGATSSTYTTSSLSNTDQIKVICNNPPSIVNDNSLQLWLDAGNSASYSSGTTWSDLSGKNNHGTLMNGASFDATSKSIVTNGVDQYVSVPLFNNSTSNTTMQTWVYINANSHGGFMANGTSSYSIGIGSNVSGEMNSNGNQAWMLFSSVRYINTNTTYSTGWHLVTMTMSASSVPSFYLDGSFVFTSSGSNPNTPSGSFNLGAVPGDGPKYYNGKFAAAYFYNRVLTASEISQNYNATVGSIGGGSGGGVTSNTITVSVSLVPTSNITVSGDACINKTTLSTTSGVYTYTWTKDNVTISGATTNTYTPPTAGDYKVSVSNGTCSSTSSTTTIYNCGVTADGKMLPTSSVSTLVSNEGGINFGTGTSETGSMFNTTGITTTTGTIGSTTAVLGGVISATNALTSSIGVIYSTDSNFGTYSTSTIQSNVGAGTYNATISGLSSSTTYFVKSFIVNKSGTSYGPQVSFTTPVRPIAVGDSYGGGIVIYIAGPSDPGYDANTTHGLIAAKVDLGSMNWNNGSIAGTSNNYFGAGIGNTSIIIAQSGSNGGTNYAAKACDDYTVTETVGGVTTTYSDWYLGSTFEIQKMMSPNPASSYLTGLLNGYYWASNEQTASGPSPGAGAVLGSALYVTKANGGLDQWNKTGGSGIMGVRAIRKF